MAYRDLRKLVEELEKCGVYVEEACRAGSIRLVIERSEFIIRTGKGGEVLVVESARMTH